jgi:hypothetical protein
MIGMDIRYVYALVGLNQPRGDMYESRLYL